jgi:hypothetical protein
VEAIYYLFHGKFDHDSAVYKVPTEVFSQISAYYISSKAAGSYAFDSGVITLSRTWDEQTRWWLNLKPNFEFLYFYRSNLWDDYNIGTRDDSYYFAGKWFFSLEKRRIILLAAKISEAEYNNDTAKVASLTLPEMSDSLVLLEGEEFGKNVSSIVREFGAVGYACFVNCVCSC